MLLVALWVLAGFAGRPAVAQATGARPNILFIALDDQNDWVGPLRGHPQVRTPHLDRLAARGVTFTNAHCQAPLCNPSRTSMLMGLRPSTTGVYALNPWFRTVPRWRDWVTLPQYLQQHGYLTMTTGKTYHDGYPAPRERVDGVEFSKWGYAGGFSPRPPRKFVTTPDANPLMDWGVFPERDEEQDDWKVADWAIAQLRNPPSRPFFLSVGLRHPHVPCYASQKWFDLYPPARTRLPAVRADDRDDTPRFSWYLHWKLPEPRLKWLERQKEWLPLVRAYLASVSFVDSQVGRILDALESSGLAENTLVVVWSDHGWHLGEKGVTGKNTLWDPSTRVPLIFAGPGVARGGRSSRPAELVDLYPTVAALCGLPPKAGLDGQSLAPQLRDPGAPRLRPAITTHGPNNHGIRTENWRYIRYADGSEELYDLRKDPREWTNLAARADLAGVKAGLAQWLPRVNAPPVPGSSTRLIEIRDGVPHWESRAIEAGASVPMDD
jgi:choline-sulfatase